MNDPFQDNLFPDEMPDNEGMFDAQLPLPLPSAFWARPLTEIIKRDGRREPFDKRKIAQAIVCAARQVGHEDPNDADSIASAVAIYLAKQLGGQTPSADQVSDAVERVLIQMAQSDIALAYARYRDRRARIRRLRTGDMRSLLSELEEARHEREAATALDPALRIRTSQDKLARWDRNRIVEALQRETGLDTTLAMLIAVEVEQQIQNAGITVLTTPLVRELVGAKLIEHGLVEENEMRRRLGVPLFDASRIMRGATPETSGRDPNATDRILAQAVKKEFALTEVFSHEVTQAHLAGELHLCDLGLVDRLHSARHALAHLAAHGLRLSRESHFASPPHHPETLLAQMVKFGDRIESLFSGSVGWYAFNFMAAPFVHQFNEKEMRHFAEMVVYECAYRYLSNTVSRDPVRLHLPWSTPVEIINAPAVGPQACVDGSTYKSFERTARRLASALIDVVAGGGVNDANFAAPLLDVVLEDTLPNSLEGAHYLRQAVHAALRRPRIRFLLHEQDGQAMAGPIWRPRSVVWHRVALNLPRVALTAGDDGSFWNALERLVALGISAHKEKRDFVELLLDPIGNAPLALLALENDGQPYISSENSTFAVDVDGLYECAQIMVGAREASSRERVRFMTSTLERLSELVQHTSHEQDIHCSLSANTSPFVSRRFASLDATSYPKLASKIVKADAHTLAMTYTPGVALPHDMERNPFETAQIEGNFHKHLDEAQFTCLTLPLRNTSDNALSDLLKKIIAQTRCHGVYLGQSTTT